jgi:hypothetical protein
VHAFAASCQPRGKWSQHPVVKACPGFRQYCQFRCGWVANAARLPGNGGVQDLSPGMMMEQAASIVRDCLYRLYGRTDSTGPDKPPGTPERGGNKPLSSFAPLAPLVHMMMPDLAPPRVLGCICDSEIPRAPLCPSRNRDWGATTFERGRRSDEERGVTLRGCFSRGGEFPHARSTHRASHHSGKLRDPLTTRGEGRGAGDPSGRGRGSGGRGGGFTLASVPLLYISGGS